jgi:hypothetical protein
MIERICHVRSTDAKEDAAHVEGFEEKQAFSL